MIIFEHRGQHFRILPGQDFYRYYYRSFMKRIAAGLKNQKTAHFVLPDAQ